MKPRGLLDRLVEIDSNLGLVRVGVKHGISVGIVDAGAVVLAVLRGAVVRRGSAVVKPFVRSHLLRGGHLIATRDFEIQFIMWMWLPRTNLYQCLHTIVRSPTEGQPCSHCVTFWPQPEQDGVPMVEGGQGLACCERNAFPRPII